MEELVAAVLPVRQANVGRDRRRDGGVFAPGRAVSGTLGGGLVRREDAGAGARPTAQQHGKRTIVISKSHVRAECMNAHWFLTRADARKV